MSSIRGDVTVSWMAGQLGPSALDWIAARTNTETRKTQMSQTFWNALITNEALTKYAIPGSLLVGGCLLFGSGYLLGSRRARRSSTSSPFMKGVGKDEIQISCFSHGRTISRANSEMSLMSSPSIDDVSERGSPVNGDNYRCALIVRKDCGLARGKIIIHCCRAFLAEFKKLYKQRDPDLKEWERDGMTVVVLRAESERELSALKARASEVGVHCHIFSARQSDGSSLKTVMALGPSKSTLVKELTQHLLRL